MNSTTQRDSVWLDSYSNRETLWMVWHHHIPTQRRGAVGFPRVHAREGSITILVSALIETYHREKPDRWHSSLGSTHYTRSFRSSTEVARSAELDDSVQDCTSSSVRDRTVVLGTNKSLSVRLSSQRGGEHSASGVAQISPINSAWAMMRFFCCSESSSSVSSATISTAASASSGIRTSGFCLLTRRHSPRRLRRPRLFHPR
jgi:hypothetical protein